MISPCCHRHHARLWDETLRSGPHATGRTSPVWLIGNVAAATATEAATRRAGGVLGKSLIAIKHLTRDVLRTIERQQAYMGFPTDGVEVYNLAQIVDGFLRFGPAKQTIRPGRDGRWDQRDDAL